MGKLGPKWEQMGTSGDKCYLRDSSLAPWMRSTAWRFPRISGRHSSSNRKRQKRTSPPGTDGSLAIYTEEGFKRLSERLAAASPNGKDVRAFSRLFFSRAEHVELDAQGRIRFSAELINQTSLGREIVLVGVRDHLEVWNTQSWDAYVKQQQQRYDELAERAFTPDEQ